MVLPQRQAAGTFWRSIQNLRWMAEQLHLWMQRLVVVVVIVVDVVDVVMIVKFPFPHLQVISNFALSSSSSADNAALPTQPSWAILSSCSR